jgi:hypothetical protein
MKQCLVALAAGLCLAAGAPAAPPAYPPRPGQAHPALTLPSIADGTPISLAQFRGKKVLLIHFASW